MNKILDFFKEVLATIFVMLGVFLVNFYVTHPFGIVTLILGLLGFFILFPAIKRWKEFLNFKKNKPN